jgi:hypothetical protein
MNQPVQLTLRVNRFGTELILNALSKLPYEQSAGLIAEIEAQANYQLQQLAAAANKPPVEAAEQTPNPAEVATNPEGEAQ